MKKIILLSLIAFVFLTGCTMDLIDGVISGVTSIGIDEKYQFATIEEFLAIKDMVETDKDYFLIEKYESAVVDVRTIDLKTVFEDIIIEESTNDKIELSYLGVFSESLLNDKPEIDVETNNSLKFHVNWNKTTGSAHALLIIKLPKDFDGDLKINAVSGDIDIETISANKVSLETVSGNIDIEKAYGAVFKLNTVSGDFVSDEFYYEDVDINTVSGEVTVSGGVGSVVMDTVSGDVNMFLNALEDDIEMNSTSGEIILTFDEIISAALDLKSISGDVSCNYKLEDVEIKKGNKLEAIVENGKFKIDINTVSGDIEIR